MGWAFWPPDTPLEQIKSAGGENQGIWIPRADSTEEEIESDDDDLDEKSHSNSGEEDEDGDQTDITEEEDTRSVGVGRFGALAINQSEEDQSEDQEDDL